MEKLLRTEDEEAATEAPSGGLDPAQKQQDSEHQTQMLLTVADVRVTADSSLHS